MTNCLPGTPCYAKQLVVYTTYPSGCTTVNPVVNGISLPLVSTYVTYLGATLPNTEIENTETLTVALQKIDEKLTPSELVNAIISAIQSDNLLRAALCAALNC